MRIFLILQFVITYLLYILAMMHIITARFILASFDSGNIIFLRIDAVKLTSYETQGTKYALWKFR